MSSSHPLLSRLDTSPSHVPSTKISSSILSLRTLLLKWPTCCPSKLTSHQRLFLSQFDSNILSSFSSLVEIENRNYFRLSPYDNQGDFQQHSFMIGFSQVQADLRDVAFYFKKKTGFPRLQDQGLADVVIGGKGIHGSIKLETTPHSSHVFKVDHVDINVSLLTI